jgi:hypothetical protein
MRLLSFEDNVRSLDSGGLGIDDGDAGSKKLSCGGDVLSFIFRRSPGEWSAAPEVRPRRTTGARMSGCVDLSAVWWICLSNVLTGVNEDDSGDLRA